MIEQGVHDVYQSDSFIEYLKFLSKFHHYSLNNTMLIFAQYPNASLVAGYAKWQNDFKRNVNKGEKAIKILAPYEFKSKIMVPVYDQNGKALYDHQGKQQMEEQEYKQTRFRVVSVFDIAQTSGQPLPELIHDLKGSSDSVKLLIEVIKEASEYPIIFKYKEDDQILKDGAKGYFDKMNDLIIVNKELDDTQQVKTLAHEYAHSLLHKQTTKTVSQKEIEAEALAFVICNHFDIDTSDYSFVYIASYANENQEFLRQTLLDIQYEAHEIINKLEPIYERMKENMIQDLKYVNPVEMEKMSIDLIDRLMKNVSGTPIYDYLRSKNIDEEFGRDALNVEIALIMEDLKSEFPIQYVLYDVNDNYRDALEESIFLRCYYDIFNPKQERPFLENSMERQNYYALESIAKPILEDAAYYMKLTTPHYMDFNIEQIGDGKIALTHFFELNGDLVMDPTVELFVDHDNKLLIPKFYQQDTLQIYHDIDRSPEYASSLNNFVKDWISNVKRCHFKIHEIKTNEKDYEIGITKYDEFKQFCDENGIGQYLRDTKVSKEKER